MHNNRHSSLAEMETPRSWLLASTALAVVTLVAGVVSGLLNPQGSAAAEAQVRATGPLVSTATTSLGQIIVDSRGRTLYLFQKDKNGKSACTASCAGAWPPLIAAGKPRAGAGARSSLLGTTKRTDGRTQVTYNRHPLYLFVKDTKKGQTTGENVDAFGAEWYAVSPAGTTVLPKTSGTPTESGGSGY